MNYSSAIAKFKKFQNRSYLYFTGSMQYRTGSIERPKPAYATEGHQTFPEKKTARESLSYNYMNISQARPREMFPF